MLIVMSDGTAGDRGVDEVGVDLEQPLDMLAARLEPGDLLGVAEIGDVHLVELQVAAAGAGEGLDRTVIGGAEIGEEAVEVGIDLRVDGLPSAAEMQHRGRRNGLLGHGALRMGGEELVVVDHDRLAPADLAVDAQRVVELHAAGELDLLVGLVELHAVEAGYEVVVPVGAAILAVGDGAQADLTLSGDGPLDHAVLQRAQLGIVRQLALGVRRAGGFQLGRTQEAADMVGAEGRAGARGDRRFEGR